MGRQTDARIRRWQQKAGLKPPLTEWRHHTLECMSALAFELIKVIERERSGIRDGDGRWHGSDPIGCIVRQLVEVEQEDLEASRAEHVPSSEPDNRPGHDWTCPA